MLRLMRVLVVSMTHVASMVLAAVRRSLTVRSIVVSVGLFAAIELLMLISVAGLTCMLTSPSGASATDVTSWLAESTARRIGILGKIVPWERIEAHARTILHGLVWLIVVVAIMILFGLLLVLIHRFTILAYHRCLDVVSISDVSMVRARNLIGLTGTIHERFVVVWHLHLGL